MSTEQSYNNAESGATAPMSNDQTDVQAVNEPTQPVKESESIPEVTSGTFLSAMRYAKNPGITIQSDSMLFNMLTDMGDLRELIENISAWYTAYMEQPENFTGDATTSRYLYGALMEFLPRMMFEVSQNEVREFKSTTKLAMTVSNKWKELYEMTDKSAERLYEALKTSNEQQDKAMGLLEKYRDETVRLRRTYEPNNPEVFAPEKMLMFNTSAMKAGSANA